MRLEASHRYEVVEAMAMRLEASHRYEVGGRPSL